MLTKTELLTILALPADADLASVREKVRGMENRELDAVAAQVVCGWRFVDHFTSQANDVVHHYESWAISDDVKERAWLYRDCEHQVDYWSCCAFYPTISLNSAAALIPKIEEMGLWWMWCHELSWAMYPSDEYKPGERPSWVGDIISDFSDLMKFANATARQRTEAAVLAVAGRVMQ